MTKDNFNEEYSAYYKDAEKKATIDSFLSEGDIQEKKEEPKLDKNREEVLTTSLFDRVTYDVGYGLAQAPRSALRGVVKGTNAMIDLAYEAGGLLPALSVRDKKGELSYPRIDTMADAYRKINFANKKAGKAPIEKIQLGVPSPPVKDTVTGSLIEGISQFVTGLGAVGKAGIVAKTAPQAISKGALADLLAFDEHEQRLSNVIESVPELKNSVTGYLSASPDDEFAEGKLKQTIEGVIGGGIGHAFGKALSIYKKGRILSNRFKKEGGSEQDILAKLEEPQITRDDFASIGDIDSDELFIKKFHKISDITKPDEEYVQTTMGKIAKAEQETKGFKANKRIKEGIEEPKQPEIEINFARINGEEDVKRLMQEMANHPDLIDSVQQARRGVQSTEATLKGADEIDGFDELLTRRQGEAFNDQQITAARKVYYSTTEKLLEVARKAASPQATELDQFNFRHMISVHHAIQKEVLGARAEAGRALRAWAIPLGGDNKGKIDAIEKMINEYGGAQASKALASKLVVAADSGMLNTASLNKITHGSALERGVGAAAHIWKMGLLTSLRTHEVNVSSNVLTSLVLAAERGVYGLFGDDKAKAEAVNFMVGYIGSFRQALSHGAKALRSGDNGRAFGKIELPPVSPTSREVLDPEGRLGMLTKGIDWYGNALNVTVGGALSAGDDFSKTMLYNAQLRAMAGREAAENGLTGKEAREYIADKLTNPTSLMKQNAEDFALYGTYNKELGQMGQDFQRIVRRNPALIFVFPFVRTPANIFKFTFERTPLALLSGKVREDIAAGGARKSMALTKIGLASSVMMLAVDMTLNGEQTGAGPSDKKLRDKLRNTGWQPYSRKIGDKYYSYARFEPFATYMGMASDMTEILSNYESYDLVAQDEVDELATATVTVLANQVVGKTFMTGLSDMVEVLSDPKRYADDYLNRYAKSIVPNIFGDIERAISPEMEQVFTMMDAIKSKIPGLSNEVSKRYNVYGEVIQNYYPDPNNKVIAMGERMAQLINPVYYTDQDKPKQPLDEFFLKHGLDGVSMPPKVQRFEVERPQIYEAPSVAINLREHPKIYARFMELRGEMKLRKYRNQTLKEYLTNLVERRDPSAAVFFHPRIIGTDAQQNIITNAQQDYDKAIRQQLLKEFSVLRQEVATEQKKLNKVIKLKRQTM